MDDFDLSRAKRLFWDFHWGRPPGRVLQSGGPRRVPAATVQLGTFVALELRGGGLVWPGRGRIDLGTDDHGGNLYLLSAGGIELAKKGVPVGRIVAIRYRTNKGDGDQVWRHEFENRRPVFALDRDGWPVIRRKGSQFRVTWRGIVG